MIFGQPSDIAIEVYHEPAGPQWAGFGRMAIDIDGVRLGKIRENHCSLFHAVEQLQYCASSLDALWQEGFTGLSDAEIFDCINQARYVGEPASDSDDYRCYDFLMHTGEQFDGEKTFIIRRPNARVHILYEHRDDSRGSASCTVDSFREVVGAFVSWFEEQVRNAAPPWHPVEPDL